MVQGILERVLDHNKHVQEAACSALATIAEEGGPSLTPHLKVLFLCDLAKHFADTLRSNLQ